MATRKRKRPARAPRTALGTLAAILLAAFVWAGSELGWFDAVRLAPAATPLPGDGLYVTFIDVGQGDATFASCGGETLLIDAGVPENTRSSVSISPERASRSWTMSSAPTRTRTTAVGWTTYSRTSASASSSRRTRSSTLRAALRTSRTPPRSWAWR